MPRCHTPRHAEAPHPMSCRAPHPPSFRGAIPPAMPRRHTPRHAERHTPRHSERSRGISNHCPESPFVMRPLEPGHRIPGQGEALEPLHVAIRQAQGEWGDREAGSWSSVRPEEIEGRTWAGKSVHGEAINHPNGHAYALACAPCAKQSRPPWVTDTSLLTAPNANP